MGPVTAAAAARLPLPGASGLPRLIARALRRNERPMLVFGLLPVVAAALYAALRPPRYEARATLVGAASATAAPCSRAQLCMAAEWAAAPDPELLGAAAAAAGAEAAARGFPGPGADELGRMVRAWADPDGLRLTVTASAGGRRSAPEAARMLAALTANAFARALAGRLEEARGAAARREADALRELLAARTAELRALDLRLEAERRRLEEQEGLSLPDGRDGPAWLENLPAQRQEAEARKAELAARSEALSAALRRAREQRPDPVLAQMHRSLAAVEAALAGAAERYTPEHPAYRKLRDRQEALRANIARLAAEATAGSGAGADPGELETRRSAVIAELRGVEARLEKIEDCFRKAGATGAREYLAMLGTRRELEASVAEVERGLASAGSGAPGRSGVELVPADAPREAVPAAWGPILLVTAMLSALLALGAALIAESVSPRVRDEQDLLRLPGLAFAAGVPAGGAGRARPEAARSWAEPRECLAYALPGEHRVLLAAGAVPGDAPEGAAADLAAAYALDDLRVLLVDARFSGTGPGRALRALCPDIGNAPGLGEFLAGEADAASVLLDTELPGLCVLGPGRAAGRADVRPDCARLAGLIESLRGDFDITIVDGPAVLGGEGCSAPAAAADGVLLILAAGRTTFAQAAAAVARLESAGAAVVGAALCRRAEAT